MVNSIKKTRLQTKTKIINQQNTKKTHPTDLRKPTTRIYVGKNHKINRPTSKKHPITKKKLQNIHRLLDKSSKCQKRSLTSTKNN